MLKIYLKGKDVILTQHITVFHAGSLSRPLQQIAKAFEAKNPGVTVILEGSGARVVARKVIEQHRSCDIVASADYTIIDDFLKPEYARFNIRIARNRLVLSFSEKSQYADQIHEDNWFEILLKPGVQYGHTDPELDPGGYRARLCWQLAEKYYQQSGLNDRLIANLLPSNVLTDGAIIRSRITGGELDYFFGYESTARQNGYRFINLPDAINFSSDEYAAYYQQAEVQLAGKRPGTSMRVTGQPIIYGITLVETAPNREQAIQFLEFLLDKGMPFLENSGLIPISPPTIPIKDRMYLPAQLGRFFKTTDQGL
jgi:molybdate/tungstate transport system substrate-binding protein